MEGMLAKGKAEKHDEQVQFAAYKQFCDSTSAEKNAAIKEEEEQMTVLSADIEKDGAFAKKMAKEITGHEEDVADWEGDQKSATKVRESEKAEYQAMHKDYTESIDALNRAISVLKEQAHDRAQATSLVQLVSLQNSPLVPDDAKQVISSLMQQGEADLDMAAPEAAGYEFQSHGVIEMLEKLLDKFIAERTELEKKEMNANHAYELAKQDLAAQITQAKQDIGEKTEAKAKALQRAATASGDLKDTTNAKKADTKYLEDLVATCEQKSNDFAARQQLRAEELEAISKAIEIISSGAVKGSAEKHLPAALSQLGAFEAVPALVSLRAEATSASRNRVAQLLKSRAEALDSRVLAALAERVSAGSDPFAKVKKMIQDLIVRLMEEANEETEHKGWCDTELATNEKTRKQKTESVETLQAEIDALEASNAKLTEEVTELAADVSKLDKAMAEATELRTAEKSKNEATIKDAQEAQTAVEQALVVLKDFYAKVGGATAFVQQGAAPKAPEIFDEPYKGMSGESGGVVGMLEVIESDFARLEADTKAAEATAQKEYDSFMTDSKVDKAAKTKDIEHKETKKQEQSKTLVVKKEDLEANQKELDAAVAYYDKLKPSCVDAGVSFEDRVARREEEIKSLQEALQVLNGEDLP